jgi:hypothetical protein
VYPLLQWKSNKYYRLCLCIPSLSYPAGNALRHIVILPSVACLSLPYFSSLSHKGQDFRKSVIEHKMCVLIFSTTFFGNMYHSKKNSARYFHKCKYYSRKISVILVDFYKTCIFSTYFRKIIIKFHENPYSRMPSCYTQTETQTDGRTDRQADTHT